MGIQSLLFAGSSGTDTPVDPYIASLNPRLWLDASKRGSVIRDGVNVETWNDLSGNDFHAYRDLTLSGGPPVYASDPALGGRPVLKFNGSLLVNSLATFNLLGYSVAMVMTYPLYPEIRTNSGIFSLTGPGLDFTSPSQFTINQGNSGLTLNHAASCQQDLSILPAMLYVAGRSGTDLYIYANGSQSASATTGATVSTSPGGYFLGKRYPEESFGVFNLAEFIVFPNCTDGCTRQRIEGYLAWKWGLTSQLPLGHFYKTFPPPSEVPSYDPYFSKVQLLLPLDGYITSAVVDESDFVSTLASSGVTLSGTGGPFGNGCAVFDGTGAAPGITVDGVTNFHGGGVSGTVSIEFWIYLTSYPATDQYYTVFNPENYEVYSLSVDSEGYLVTGYENVKAPVQLNRWTFVSWIHRSEPDHFHFLGIDGQFVAGTAFGVGFQPTRLVIGHSCAIQGRAFVGKLSDVRLTGNVERTIALPAEPFPTRGPADPFFSQVSHLFPFDGTTSTGFIDASENHAGVIASSAVSLHASGGPFGNGCASFNGLNYGTTEPPITLPASDKNILSDYDFSMEVWIYLYDYPEEGSTYYIFSNTGGRHNLRVNSAGLLQFNNTVSTPNQVPLGTWVFVHVYGFQATGVMSAYMDGVFQRSDNTGSFWDMQTDFVIGQLAGTNSGRFKGLMSDFRLTLGRVRCSSNVPTASFPTRSPVEPDPYFDVVSMLLQPTNEVNGSTTFTDRSSNELLITGNGAPKWDTGSTLFCEPTVLLNGSTDWLTVNSTNFVNMRYDDFTIEAWVKPTSGSYGMIDARPNTNVNNFALAFRSPNNSPLGIFRDGPWQPDETHDYGTFRHIQWVRESGINRLAVNGVVAPNTYPYASTFAADGASVQIGRLVEEDNYLLNGRIGSMRVTKGIARPFTVPTGPFPTFGSYSSDPYFNYVFALIRPTGRQDSTTVVDYGPTARTINNNGVTKDTSYSKFNTGSLSFPGESALNGLYIPNFQLFSGYTLVYECWVQPWAWTTDPEGDPLFDFSASGSESSARLTILIKEDGRITTRYNYAFGSRTEALALNTWAHFAFTIDLGGTLTAYVNGVASMTRTGVFIEGVNNLFIGRMVDAAHPSLHANLEEVRITIAPTLRYTENFTPPHAPFSTTQGSPVYLINDDFSSTPPNATLVGSAYISGGECVLTPVAQYQGGDLVYDFLANSPTAFEASFYYRSFEGTGADGTSFNYGVIISSGAELGIVVPGLAICLVEFNGPQRIIIKMNSVAIATIFTPVISSAYQLYTCFVDKNGILSIERDGTLIVEQLDLGYTYIAADKSDWQFALSARTGLHTNRHSVRSFSVRVNSVRNGFLRPPYTPTAIAPLGGATYGGTGDDNLGNPFNGPSNIKARLSGRGGIVFGPNNRPYAYTTLEVLMTLDADCGYLVVNGIITTLRLEATLNSGGNIPALFTYQMPAPDFIRTINTTSGVGVVTGVYAIYCDGVLITDSDAPLLKNPPFYPVRLLLPLDGSTSSTIVDASLTSNTVSSSGATVSSTGGPFGNGCVVFNGISEGVNLTPSAQYVIGRNFRVVDGSYLFNSAHYTIETWVCIDAYPAPGDWATIFSTGETQAITSLSINSEGVIDYVGTAQFAGMELRRWYFVCINASGTSNKIFIDGQLVANYGSYYNSTSQKMSLGQIPDSTLPRFTGRLSNFRYTLGLARDGSIVPSAPFLTEGPSQPPYTPTAIAPGGGATYGGYGDFNLGNLFNGLANTKTVLRGQNGIIFGTNNKPWANTTLAIRMALDADSGYLVVNGVTTSVRLAGPTPGGWGGTPVLFTYAMPAPAFITSISTTAGNGAAIGAYAIYCDGVLITDFPPPEIDPYFANVQLLLKMDGANGSTVFTDSSPAQKVVTAVRSATISTNDSRFGNSSAYFEPSGGLASWIQTDGSDVTFTGGGTIEFWAKGTGHFFYKGTHGIDEQLGLWAFGTGVTFGSNSGDYSYSEQCVFDPSSWQHIAVAYSASESCMRVFINGVIGISSIRGTIDSEGLLTIGGAIFNSPAFPFTGYIDEFRYTKGICRYVSNFTPPTEPFPTQGPRPPDPHFGYVSLLLKMQNGVVGGSTFTDLSLLNRSIVATGDIKITDANSKFGTTSAVVNTLGSYLDISNATYIGDLTWECWWSPKVTEPIAGYRWLFLLNGSLVGLTLSDDGGPRRFFVGPPYYATNGEGGASFVFGEWYHLAMTVQENTVRTFINGVLYQVGELYPISGALPLRVMWHFSGSNGNFGYIDSMRETTGVARYITDFTPPTEPFPTQGPPLLDPDPYFSSVELLLPLDGSTSSTIFDASNNANTISSSGATLSSTGGPFGNGCAVFDGTSPGIIMTPSAQYAIGYTGSEVNAFTLEVWFYLTALTDTGELTVIFDGGEYLSQLYIQDSTIRYGVGVVALENEVQLNTWYFVSIVHSSPNLKIYVNGALELNFNYPWTDLGATSQNMSIGPNPAAGYRGITGRISNFRYTLGEARDGSIVPTDNFPTS